MMKRQRSVEGAVLGALKMQKTSRLLEYAGPDNRASVDSAELHPVVEKPSKALPLKYETAFEKFLAHRAHIGNFDISKIGWKTITHRVESDMGLFMVAGIVTAHNLNKSQHHYYIELLINDDKTKAALTSVIAATPTNKSGKVAGFAEQHQAHVRFHMPMEDVMKKQPADGSDEYGKGKYDMVFDGRNAHRMAHGSALPMIPADNIEVGDKVVVGSSVYGFEYYRAITSNTGIFFNLHNVVLVEKGTNVE